MSTSPLCRSLFPMVIALALGACASSSDDSDNPSFQFGTTEMEQAIVGDWQGELTLATSPATPLNVHIEHKSGATKPACGTRELMNPQCIDMTSMALNGTVTTGDGSYSQALCDGSFEVMGLELKQGYLNLHLADGRMLTANYANGALSDGRVTKDYNEVGSFTLKRK